MIGESIIGGSSTLSSSTRTRALPRSARTGFESGRGKDYLLSRNAAALVALPATRPVVAAAGGDSAIVLRKSRLYLTLPKAIDRSRLGSDVNASAFCLTHRVEQAVVAGVSAHRRELRFARQILHRIAGCERLLQRREGARALAA